jgi:CPA2 family monovalent cation:H+ antiporter-2
MPQDSVVISTLAIGFVLAFCFGYLARRVQLPPLMGYLVAGVLIGPFTPGIVGDTNITSQLAEMGVILLMFGVGLHFSLKDLLSVRSVVIPGAIVQVAAATALGAGVALFLGWDLGAGIVFGLALSVGSTVVLTRALQNRHLVDTARGHIAVGWLVVQDLLTVVALVLLPALTGVLQGANFEWTALTTALSVTFGKLGAFVLVMVLVGSRVIPWVLHYVAHTGSRELFRLAVLSVALGVAFAAAELFGVSFALGAFFAGMILNESALSQRAAEESLPLRDAFAVLFFVSVGMLFNPTVVITETLPLLMVIAVVLVGNAGIAFLMLRIFRKPAGDALTVGIGLAQIGEFSFILAGLGIALGVLTNDARDLILGASIVTIFLNPFLFAAAERMRPRLDPHPKGAPVKPAEEALPPTELSNHAVLVGYGRVGQLVGEVLISDGWKLLVIEDAADIVERLRGEGIEIIRGNAAENRVLKAANIAGARLLLVAIPDGFEAGQIVHQARAANPMLPIIARAHFDAEVDHLKHHGADVVIMGEREIARTMLEYAKEPGMKMAREPVVSK